MRAVWNNIGDADLGTAAVREAATCPQCNGAVYRPDVVLFGQPVSNKFMSLSHKDLKEADLLIVMGTSLTVYPFAGLVNQVSATVPRLLINREVRGPWKVMLDSQSPGEESSFRDAAFLGDCDEGVEQLCREMGWHDELMGLATCMEKEIRRKERSAKEKTKGTVPAAVTLQARHDQLEWRELVVERGINRDGIALQHHTPFEAWARGPGDSFKWALGGRT